MGKLFKIWRVDLSTWIGGKCRTFWRKESALQFAKDNWDYPFITLVNERTGVKTGLRNDPSGKAQVGEDLRRWGKGTGSGQFCPECGFKIVGSICSNKYCKFLSGKKQKG